MKMKFICEIGTNSHIYFFRCVPPMAGTNLEQVKYVRVVFNQRLHTFDIEAANANGSPREGCELVNVWDQTKGRDIEIHGFFPIMLTLR